MSQDYPSNDSDRFIPSFAEAPVGAILGRVAAIMFSVGTLCIGGLMALVVADVLGRMEASLPDGAPLFGAIDQRVVRGS